MNQNDHTIDRLHDEAEKQIHHKLENPFQYKMTALEKKLRRNRIIRKIAERIINACLLATISLAFAEITMTVLILLL